MAGELKNSLHPEKRGHGERRIARADFSSGGGGEVDYVVVVLLRKLDAGNVASEPVESMVLCQVRVPMCKTCRIATE